MIFFSCRQVVILAAFIASNAAETQKRGIFEESYHSNSINTYSPPSYQDQPAHSEPQEIYSEPALQNTYSVQDGALAQPSYYSEFLQPPLIHPQTYDNVDSDAYYGGEHNHIIPTDYSDYQVAHTGYHATPTPHVAQEVRTVLKQIPKPVERIIHHDNPVLTPVERPVYVENLVPTVRFVDQPIPIHVQQDVIKPQIKYVHVPQPYIKRVPIYIQRVLVPRKQYYRHRHSANINRIISIIRFLDDNNNNNNN